MIDDPRYRLPRTVLPTHYALRIVPDLAAAAFEGTATVTLDVGEPVRQILCNAAELDIREVVVTDATGTTQDGVVTPDEDLERISVDLEGPVAVGKATVTFSYTGVLNDKLRGFYRSTFTGSDGLPKIIATTQFEATDARRAFPCWDEPDIKATYELEMFVPEGLAAYSNTAAVWEQAATGGRWQRFAPTMPMSTYLVAWVIGPLETTEPVEVEGVPLRVVCVPGRQPLARFALDVATHALRFYRDYFGIPYPGDKLDLVALPDFAFGAMENLGCVTFRETALLVDDANASRVELERVAEVVAHEIAHMWFGDLVTMRWWNGIWLNEAFATFMEVLCVDAFRPAWQMWVNFSTSRAFAMLVDALHSTRTVEYPVVSPEDAEGMFDVLTYQKGAALLRMLERYLGAEGFRDGIRLYLDTHRYANTDTNDLWDALEQATGEPVRALMDSWIFVPGYPELQVGLTERTLTLAQRRFLLGPAPDQPAQSGEAAAEDAEGAAEGAAEGLRHWYVPVLLKTGAETRRVLLDDASTALVLDRPDEPLVANTGGWGFFRTTYTPELLARLAAGFERLDPIERFNLVSDTWAATYAGRAELPGFASLLRGLVTEADPAVWEAALGPLDLLHRIAPPAGRDALAGFLAGLARPALDRLGWQPASGEPERTGTLRGLLLNSLGTIGNDRDVRRWARQAHAGLLTDRSSVPGDLAGPAVTVAAWCGDATGYDECYEQFQAASTPQEEMRYLFALAEFRAGALVARTLDLCLGEVRTQNAPYVVQRCLANRWQGALAWRWVESHWDEVLTRYPDNSIGRMLEGVVSLTEPETAGTARAWLRAHPVPQARLQIEQILERLAVSVAFRQREGDRLAGVLEDSAQSRLR